MMVVGHAPRCVLFQVPCVVLLHMHPVHLLVLSWARIVVVCSRVEI